MIERKENPLARLRVVEPLPARSGLVTQRELDGLRHWSRVGQILTCGLVVVLAVYVVSAWSRLPW